MGADDTLRVEPAVMQGFAASLDGAAEHLAVQLAELDAQVGQMLGGWRGASGSAYGSAWELWHRGAGEVQPGLSMLAAAIAHAGAGYQHNETASAQVLREVGGG
ncbi:pore-forming CpnT exporter EsxF [Mycobacterium tuberculosis]|uniref:pore-forming CpnT exporter EsxF n=1 Tax=Mycobacterium tuberculosis TaxID=1773 RepID=UPI00254F3DCB|nr:pore-forming CpnT exporter EsxF [Mycobacterium tuberculosis]